jgi:mono/diheme cytochrome c family protein
LIPKRRFNIAIMVLLSGLYTGSKADDSIADLNRPLTVEEAQSLTNSVAPTGDSVAKGRTAYLRYACTTCHGDDGRALTDFAGPATNLTNPSVWTNGITDGEIFRSIRDGVSAMPAFGQEVDDTDGLWHLVNYIRSLWPDEAAKP